MSETKFTPGPWVLNRGQWGYHGDGDWNESDGWDEEPLTEDDKPFWLDDNGGGFHIIMRPDERSGDGSVQSRALIELYEDHMPGERGYQERKANALLIAAAPDLYEALENLREAIGANLAGIETSNLGDAFEAARVALAKARGEATR